MIDPKELNEMQAVYDATNQDNWYEDHAEIRTNWGHNGTISLAFVNYDNVIFCVRAHENMPRLIAEVKALNAALDVMNDDGQQNEVRLVNDVRRLKLMLNRDQVLMERTMKDALGLREALEFYADYKNWSIETSSNIHGHVISKTDSICQKDGGKSARETLDQK